MCGEFPASQKTGFQFPNHFLGLFGWWKNTGQIEEGPPFFFIPTFTAASTAFNALFSTFPFTRCHLLVSFFQAMALISCIKAFSPVSPNLFCRLSLSMHRNSKIHLAPCLILLFIPQSQCVRITQTVTDETMYLADFPLPCISCAAFHMHNLILYNLVPFFNPSGKN